LLPAGAAVAQSRRVRAASHAEKTAAPVRRLTLDEMIEIASAEAGISPHLLAAVVHQESGGQWWVVSPKGAGGLAQLMPATAARFGVRNRFDPMQNLRGGALYLRWLLDRYSGDVKLALAGYNAGEGSVDRYGRVPPYRETQNYVASIYPRFVISATRGQNAAVRPQATAQQAAALKQPRDPRAQPSEEVRPKKAAGSEVDASARSTGASVYFWSPARSVAPGVLPN
jgi:hypothetical protein